MSKKRFRGAFTARAFERSAFVTAIVLLVAYNRNPSFFTAPILFATFILLLLITWALVGLLASMKR